MQRSYVIKPELGKSYPFVSHGKGIYLYDKEGNRYIDGCSGAVTASIGHGVEEIAEAMYAQARSVSFAYRSHFSSDAVEELGAKLAEWAPGSLNWSFFVSSGSEATETAQKIAIQYWQEKGYATKNRIISRWMSYHGITMGALSMSGHVLRRKRFVPLLADGPKISPPYPYRRPEGMSLEAYALACANELETAILRIGPEHVAAFIAEPVIGASGGAVVPPDGYFQRIREICDKYQVLFIADEVMTGVGRTGKPFGIDHWGVQPDLMALGKGMSAGYTPMAAAMATDDIIETIARGSGLIMAGHTYSANPQSAAVSLAVLRYVEKHQLVEKAAERGAYLLSRLRELADELPLIGEARGLGMLCGLEFVKDKKTREPFPLAQGVTARIIKRAFEKGLLIYPATGGLDGVAGDAVIIAPPLTITTEEIDELIALLKESIASVEQELRQEALLV
ncbi:MULTISPECIES: aspartate aminotransferase family protein [Brevibacillus]|jgi:adenosylmethionine-8-amino-7-oxononanoate aminotransferase|uniref:Aspartate aminotransferase family protein n=1 Tax=Brevibacillus aydinogluensis TaxID=927786 RepID=A0AA48RI89_9BACL|nr:MULTISPECIES: aspartate aminotransferase family protein [Bacillales]MBR8661770.1 aspartate aminotransferase family protein [Brevibacillus sp. NL20B1]MDT3416559.1 adenosylmethionine-8-amino-7-oxononanoate aminotransferase [Brevibacillus aydinogluensis]UFJ60151.1 aspartate aminotransferase family protein [Anoxybacillus sediminis]CAJ1003200.1 aspartate aminotransferase family protein [Brevibacillus aydinogluensis]